VKKKKKNWGGGTAYFYNFFIFSLALISNMPENKISNILLKWPVTITEIKGRQIQTHEKWEVISQTAGTVFQ